jgi:hypothetical protein
VIRDNETTPPGSAGGGCSPTPADRRVAEHLADARPRACRGVAGQLADGEETMRDDLVIGDLCLTRKMRPSRSITSARTPSVIARAKRQ